MAMTVFVAALLSVFTGFVVSDPNGSLMPVDCSALYKAGQKLSGIYSIYPTGDVPIWVYCHMISDGKDEDNGGWTVIQRRMDGSVNFYQGWEEYKRGFGATEGEYWLGLENMYRLTRNRKYMLRVDMEDFQGQKVFALYSSFSVSPETDGYKLHVSGFKNRGGAGDSLSYHNGQKFTTFDKDQDTDVRNCAKTWSGAFWYLNCYYTNPNGLYLGRGNTRYAVGTIWSSWKKNYTDSLKSISMKIKRVS